MHNRQNGLTATFIVSPRFGSPPEASLLREQFARAISGAGDLSIELAAKESAYPVKGGMSSPPKISWFDEEVSGSTTAVFELRATDRIGLLYRVADVLRDCSAEVSWAKVSTLGGTVIDSFAVTAPPGQFDAAWKKEIERTVLQVAEPAVPSQ